MKTQWINNGNKFFQGEVSNQQPHLHPGVYRVDFDETQRIIFLTKTDDAFKIPSKLYGTDVDFANRCVKTYHSTKGNLGILLNGVRGTGKTVTAQLISNSLNLPVLVVHDRYDGLSQFVNTIQQDMVLFIDEYEKIYNHYDHSVLTVMDGVLSTSHRRVFLFTTNDAYVNQNMLQRPSRIRYVKEFGDLSRKVIEEVVDDLLLFEELREDTIEYLSTLETITIDIAKTLVEEVNIHRESPKVFGEYFNTKQVENEFAIYKVDNIEGKTEESTMYHKTSVFPIKITTESIGQPLIIGEREHGTIKSVIGDLVVFEDYDDKMMTIRIVPLSYTHKSFSFIL